MTDCDQENHVIALPETQIAARAQAFVRFAYPLLGLAQIAQIASAQTVSHSFDWLPPEATNDASRTIDLGVESFSCQFGNIRSSPFGSLCTPT